MGHRAWPPCRQISGLGRKYRPRASSPPTPHVAAISVVSLLNGRWSFTARGAAASEGGGWRGGSTETRTGAGLALGASGQPSVSAVTNVTRTYVCPGPCPTDVRVQSVCPKPMNPVRRTFDSHSGVWTGAGRLRDAVPCPPASEMGPRSKTCTRQTVQHGRLPGVWVVSGGVRPAGLWALGGPGLLPCPPHPTMCCFNTLGVRPPPACVWTARWGSRPREEPARRLSLNRSQSEAG